jgi:hypothetical protein
MSSDAWHCYMQSGWAETRNAHGFETFETHPSSTPAPPCPAIRSIRGGFPQNAIAETSTSFQNALGSRTFTGKERPSFLVSRFDRAGRLALGPGRSYGLSWRQPLSAHNTPSPISGFRSLRPTFPVLLPAILQFASSSAARLRIPRREFSGPLSASLFTWGAVFHSGSCSLIHLLRRKQNSRLSPNGAGRYSERYSGGGDMVWSFGDHVGVILSKSEIERFEATPKLLEHLFHVHPARRSAFLHQTLNSFGSIRNRCQILWHNGVLEQGSGILR